MLDDITLNPEVALHNILKPRSTEDVPESIQALISDLDNNRVSEEQLDILISFFPRERMRKLVHEYAGLDASMLMTLTQQVKLMDAVVGQLIDTDGTLKQVSGVEISLKDALNISARVTQMILRDLPKIYSLERTMNLEVAMGDIMEEYFTPEQQQKVLQRLEELSINP